jgi:hypothetical protein
VLGVVLLIIDALQERKRREAGPAARDTGPAHDSHDLHNEEDAADYPADAVDEADATSAHPDFEDAPDGSAGDEHNTR